MKFSLSRRASELQLTTEGDVSGKVFNLLSNLLDHAIFKKEEVKYDGKGTLTIRLRRNEFEKKSRQLLWFKVWLADRDPTRSCLLTIRDVISCQIDDRDSKLPQKELVTIGGIHFQDSKISLSSFCGRESEYLVTLHVRSINISLEDFDSA